jgi:hypothetical protein
MISITRPKNRTNAPWVASWWDPTTFVFKWKFFRTKAEAKAFRGIMQAQSHQNIAPIK